MQILTAGSGITVLFKRIPSKLVSCKYYIRCGSVDEVLPEQEGLCHALEHMLFQGTTQRSWQDQVHDFNKVGAYSNAETDFGHTAYEIHVAQDRFESAFEILSDQVYNATLPNDRWEIEKGTIISEIEDFQDTPAELLNMLAMKDGFGPNYKEPIGNIENIKNAKIENLAYFKDTFYRGRNIFICVAGNLSSKALLKIIGKYDKWQPQRCRVRRPPEFKFDPRVLLVEREHSQQSYITWIKPIKRYTRVREEMSLDIGLYMLYNYLYEDIVWDRGLCYNLRPMYFMDVEGCECIYINAACSNGRLEQIVEDVPKAIDVFLKTQMTSDKIEEAKLAWVRDALDAEESSSIITSWMGHAYLNNRTKDPFDEIFKGAPRIKDHTIRGILTECLIADTKLCVMGSDSAKSPFYNY